MNSIILISGGVRSGKSNYAIQLARSYPGKRAYIATAEPIDNEMRTRIEKHKKERGKDFLTIEQPLKLAEVLNSLSRDIQVTIIDCLTVWLGNLLFCYKDEQKILFEIDLFINSLNTPASDLIIVTNEVGMGIVPDNAEGRLFRDFQGIVNQKVASLAEKVVLMVCGIPVFIKGGFKNGSI